MSKLSFRARALDASKPMPIFMAEELPDLPEYSAINRAVPQMPSGMEKEEECEHHLQRAICAGLIIPTPEVQESDLDAYNRLYPSNYKQPRQLIHMQPFAMEQDIPDYDMDSEDERWLVSQAKKLDLTPLKFEEMMDRLEKSSGQTVVTLNEAKALLKEDDDLIIAVFDYWLNKRLKTQHPLILSVKTEHRTGSSANNPYLAFRRRTEKMQTRKNRKNDETSYEKMLKLRRDLSRAVTLLEMVKRREKTKREYLHLTIEIYEKRYQAQDFNGTMLAEVSQLKATRPAFTQLFQNHYSNQSWANKVIIKDEIIPRKEKRQYKKRKHKNSTHSRLSTLPGDGGIDGLVSSDEDEILPPQHSPEPEEAEDEGPFVFRRNKLCNYHMPIQNGLGNWPWCAPQENGVGDRKYRYTLTSLRNPRRCIGFARRRLGRGGRVILDRITTDFDDLWRHLDFSVTDCAKFRTSSSSTTTTSSLSSGLVLNSNNNNTNSNKLSIETNNDNLMMMSNLLTTSGDTNICLLRNNNNSVVHHHQQQQQQTICVGMNVSNSALVSNINMASDVIIGSGSSNNINSASGSASASASVGIVRGTNESVVCDIKKEPIEQDISRTNFNIYNNNNNINSNSCSNNNYNIDSQKYIRNESDLIDVLQEIRRDWLHFRPKTPPPATNINDDSSIEESLCNPFSTTPISIELQQLSSTLDTGEDMLFTTTPFSLHDLYSDTVVTCDSRSEQQTFDLLSSSSSAAAAAAAAAATTTTLSSSLSSSSSSSSSSSLPDDERLFGCSRFRIVDSKNNNKNNNNSNNNSNIKNNGGSTNNTINTGQINFINNNNNLKRAAPQHQQQNYQSYNSNVGTTSNNCNNNNNNSNNNNNNNSNGSNCTSLSSSSVSASTSTSIVLDGLVVSPPKKQQHSILSSTLTSPKYNSVNVTSPASSSSSSLSLLESQQNRPKHAAIVNHINNGPLTHSELLMNSSGNVGVRKGIKVQHHNAYNTIGGAAAATTTRFTAATATTAAATTTTTNTLNSDRNLRIAQHTTVTSHNTLNHSHSANMSDLGSLSHNEQNTSDNNMSTISTTASNSSNSNTTATTSTTTTSATTKQQQQSSNNNKQTLVRKNNSLPMEVT